MALELSPDQRLAYDQIDAWCGANVGMINPWSDDEEADLFRMGGLAGTGKTTLVSKFAKDTPFLVAYAALTGRAASLLTRKFKAMNIASTSKVQLPSGMKLTGRAAEVCYTENAPEAKQAFVGTIHRLLYRPIIDEKTEELKGWAKRTKLDRKYHLIVIDEASMVGDEVIEDLKAFKIPILLVGDHGQLPPVMSKGSLMQSPDVRLEKIHRQAEGNPVIELAHHIRNGGLLREFKAAKRGGQVEFVGKGEVGRVLEETLPGGFDTAVISWTNRMRVKLNGMSRVALGRKGVPQKGELVVALKNYPPVMNGMRGELVKDAERSKTPWHVFLDVSFPEEGLTENVVACAPQFNREKTYGSVEELQERGIPVESMGAAGQLYDFGYALTCHKMQGSQAKHVVVYLDRPEDPDTDDYRRWMYTAVTRSSDRLTILK